MPKSDTAADAAPNAELDAANTKIKELTGTVETLTKQQETDRGTIASMQAALDAANAAKDAAENEVTDLKAALEQSNTDNGRLVDELSKAHAERDHARENLAKFDHDGDGEPGGSLPRHEVKMTHPEKIGATWGGATYAANKQGVVKVPVAASEDLRSHGFEIVGD